MATTKKKTTKTTLNGAKPKKVVKKKKTLWDIALELQKKPLIKVLDEDLVYGTNMMPRLMLEK